MTRVLRTLAAFATAAILVPLGAAEADPLSCSGSPEVPEAYVCIARIEANFGLLESNQPVDVPSQEVGVEPTTVTVESETFTVSAHPVHIPQVCPALTICVGPFDTATPEVTQTTPGASQTIPGRSENTPPVHADVPVLTPYANSTIVLWYQSKCYYVRTDGSIIEANSASPATCP